MSQTTTFTKRLSEDPGWMKHPVVSAFFSSTPRIILFVAIFLLYGYFLSHKIDLVTADLGRHIMNGEVLFQSTEILRHNVYSYTNPDFEVLNHHWGSGIIFARVWSIGGFVGLQLFFILLSFLTLGFFILSAKRLGGWGLAGVITLCAIPLLGERTEIRPEVFSYLFSGIAFYLLSRYRTDSSARSYKLLWFLPLLEILWVNTHIYFLLGPLLIGAFLLEALFRYRARFLPLLSIFGATTFATLVNPFGIRALTGTLTFFDNFGYKLAENQSVWFLENLGFRDPNFLIFKIAFGLLVVSFIALLIRKYRAFPLAYFFVAGGISTLALFASRNITLFAFFLIPILTLTVSPYLQKEWRGHIVRWGAGLACVVLFFALLLGLPKYFPYWRVFGWGLLPNNSRSIEFIQDVGVHGPIFNNYDIGGYLIFHLFPEEKVFVDNRPEAYPVSFFSDEYIPMQEDSAKWEQALETYNFNAIVFSYHDATPWGQAFLGARIDDPTWAPVYVDDRVLIFVRRTSENQAIGEAYEIPRSVFGRK